MYYEQKNKGTIRIIRRPHTGVVALRVTIGRVKFEEALFKWPLEAWHEGTQTILPRSLTDADYVSYLQKLIEIRKNAIHILMRDDVNSRDTFRSIYTRKIPTLLDCLNTYTSTLEVSEKTKTDYDSKVKMIIQIIGNVPIDQISLSKISLIDEYYLSKSRVSAVMIHSLLSRAIQKALIDGYIAHTPYAFFSCTVKKKEESQPVTSSEAMESLWSAWEQEQEGEDKRAMQLYLLQIYTGARYSDACRITLSDFERGYYISKKTRKKTVLFLSDRLKLICPLLPINLTYNQYRYRLKRISSVLGYNYAQTHAARRSFASRVYSATGDLKLAGKSLGHTSIQSTERYVKVDDADVREAIKIVGEI